MKKKSLIIIAVAIITITAFISFNVINQISFNSNISEISAIENGYTISCSGNTVTVLFSNTNGIKSIDYPGRYYDNLPKRKDSSIS